MLFINADNPICSKKGTTKWKSKLVSPSNVFPSLTYFVHLTVPITFAPLIFDQLYSFLKQNDTSLLWFVTITLKPKKVNWKRGWVVVKAKRLGFAEFDAIVFLYFIDGHLQLDTTEVFHWNRYYNIFFVYIPFLLLWSLIDFFLSV